MAPHKSNYIVFTANKKNDAESQIDIKLLVLKFNFVRILSF
jgi:hypothetical protein